MGPERELRSEEELSLAAARVATPSRELVLATVESDGTSSQLALLRQWAAHLGSRAANLLLVGADAAVCELARNASLPCFTDALAPAVAPATRAETVKWLYVSSLLRLGYDVVYSDIDVAWLRDPLAAWERGLGFDLQSLSDIRSPTLETQDHHIIECLDKARDRSYQLWRNVVYPCASDGLFLVRSTAVGRAFAAGMLAYGRDNPKEWRRAFQLMVMRFLIGLGDELPPLRFRLLPPSRFVNLPMFEARRARGLATAETVAVRCGYISGGERKLERLRSAGLEARVVS